MVQKNPPPECNLGPKYSASGWSLVRKKKCNLDVQFEDVNDLSYMYVPHTHIRIFMTSTS